MSWNLTCRLIKACWFQVWCFFLEFRYLKYLIIGIFGPQINSCLAWNLKWRLIKACWFKIQCLFLFMLFHLLLTKNKEDIWKFKVLWPLITQHPFMFLMSYNNMFIKKKCVSVHTCCKCVIRRKKNRENNIKISKKYETKFFRMYRPN